MSKELAKKEENNTAKTELARRRRLGLQKKQEQPAPVSEPKGDDRPSLPTVRQAEELARARRDLEERERRAEEREQRVTAAVEKITALAERSPEPEPEPMPDPRKDTPGFLARLIKDNLAPTNKQIEELTKKFGDLEADAANRANAAQVNEKADRLVSEITRMRQEYEATEEGKGYSERLEKSFKGLYGFLVQNLQMHPDEAKFVADRRIEVMLDEASRMRLNPAFWIDFNLKHGLPGALVADSNPQGGDEDEIESLRARASAGSAGSLSQGAGESDDSTKALRSLNAKVSPATLRRAAAQKAKEDGIPFDDARRALLRELTSE